MPSLITVFLSLPLNYLPCSRPKNDLYRYYVYHVSIFVKYSSLFQRLEYVKFSLNQRFVIENVIFFVKSYSLVNL